MNVKPAKYYICQNCGQLMTTAKDQIACEYCNEIERLQKISLESFVKKMRELLNATPENLQWHQMDDQSYIARDQEGRIYRKPANQETVTVIDPTGASGQGWTVMEALSNIQRW